MAGKVTYHQQVSYCGKPRCRKCREGTGHGPYWYAYQTVEGRTTRTYIGKQLPDDVQAMVEEPREQPAHHMSEIEQSTIRIYVLGQFRLERRSGGDASEWQTVTDAAWQHQRVRALLARLVSSPGRKLAREQIMDALWPELDLESSASRLDRAVYSLRQIFEPSRGRLATSPLLLTEREMLVLAEHPQVWIDADVFDSLLIQAHASNDPGEKERLFEEAAALYGGDFLPEGRKAEWTLVRREALQRSWIGLLLDLADQRIAREALTSAIEPLDRLLSIDPANEAAVQRLISLLAQLGRRGEALRAYKRLATVLQQEYKIAPLPETRALYDALRSGADKLPSQRLAVGENTGVAKQDSVTGQVARQDTPSPIQIGRSHQSPLVGREQEFNLLRGLVVNAEHTAKFKLAAQKKSAANAFDVQRRPQCVLLFGEVGIGKTRLAEEASREAKKRGWAVAWSRVYAQEGSIPYRLWTEVFRKAMAQGAWQRQEVGKRPLVFQPLVALLPELHELLPQVTFPSSQLPEQEQLRLWEAARELLTIISDSTPLLIALDDLQWADSSSCELLAYLARRVQNHPIVIVGTCRENELGAKHPLRLLLTDLQRENAVETVQLQPLSDEHISEIVSSVPDLPEPMVQRIRSHAAGNPFFAEELARTIGALYSTPKLATGPQILKSSISNKDSDAIPQLPDTITAVLDLRLNRLSSACQRLLSKAAVLGGSFEFHVINAMEANVPGSDEDTVLDLLEEALRSGMLTEEGTGTRIAYHFWHPLLVSHLYEGLSAARRASLHRRAAEILQHVYLNHEEEGAATITHHLVRGGADSQLIVRFAELAGDRAYSLSSYPDAEQHYRIALEHLDSRPDEQPRLAYLLERLGECTRFQGKNEEARRFYEQVLDVRSQKRIFVSRAEELQEAQIDALLWCATGWTWYNTGNNVQALRCYERGEQALNDVEVTDGPAWANIRLQQSHVSWRGGNYDEARRAADDALKLFERSLKQQKDSTEKISRLTHTRRTLAGDIVNLGRTYTLLGLIANGAGQSSDALLYLNRALTLYEQHASQREIAIVCCNLGDVHLRKAEHSLAQAFFRRSLSLAERIGETPLISVIFNNLGILAARSGDLAEAETWYKRGLVLAERVSDHVSMSILNTYLTTVLQDQGKSEEAKRCILKALSVSRSMKIAPCVGFALVVLGNMRITQVITANLGEENSRLSQRKIARVLKHAKITLQRALALEGMEAETRTEGQLALALTMLLLDEVQEALELATRTLGDARQFELTWLIARAQRLLGSIFAAKGEYEQAYQYFEQALRSFRKSGMRLEVGHTLHVYGVMLVQGNGMGGKEYKRGLGYLQEALQMFTECKAVLDMQIVRQVLIDYGQIGKVQPAS